jgi:hypothetical protein
VVLVILTAEVLAIPDAVDLVDKKDRWGVLPNPGKVGPESPDVISKVTDRLVSSERR